MPGVRTVFVLLAVVFVMVHSAVPRGRVGAGSRKSSQFHRNLKRVTMGIVLPQSTFRQRKYNSTVLAALNYYQRAKVYYTFTRKYDVTYSIAMVGRKPSPTGK